VSSLHQSLPGRPTVAELPLGRRSSHMSIAASVTRRPIAILVFFIGLAVGFPAALAALSGNFAIPHNDAWAYSLIAERFARTGSITLVGWNRAFTLGQAVLLGPLGRSIVAQQLLVVVLAVLALGATFLLLRTMLSIQRALFGTTVVGAFPGFGLLATSFMADVPAFCAILATLLVGVVAIRRRSFTGVLIATAVGIWGFTVREQAIVAPACVLISAFFAWTDRASRMKLVVLAVATFVGVVTLETWRHSLAHGDAPNAPGAGLHAWHSEAYMCVSAFFTLGLLVLPASVGTSRPSSWSIAARWTAGLTGLMGVIAVARHHPLLLGNYLDLHGAYSAVLLGTRNVLPHVVWSGLELAAWVGGMLLAGAVIDRARKLDLAIGLFGLFTVLGTAFEALVGQRTFDRYLLPLMPVALIVILGVSHPYPIPRWRVVAAAGTLIALSTTSLVITANGLAFDAARWSGAQSVVSRGIKAQAIDAGLEWVGYHYPRGPTVRNHERNKQRAGLPWYAQSLFPAAQECYVLTSSMDRGLGRVVQSFNYRTYLAFGHSRLLLYDTGRCHGSG
jgi:hypothetical protein